MCQNCDKEKEKHESKNHHVTNYEKYLKLYHIFKNNFQGIKQIISSQEKNINEYKNLITFLEQQKTAYLNLFNSIHKQIKKVYTQNQESLNRIIAEIMHNIAKLKNFMINIKSYISKQFKEIYDEINNLDIIDKEIKKRIEQLNLEEFNKADIIEIKNKYFKTLNSNVKSQSFTLNKAEIIKGIQQCNDCGIFSKVAAENTKNSCKRDNNRQHNDPLKIKLRGRLSAQFRILHELPPDFQSLDGVISDAAGCCEYPHIPPARR